MVAWAPPSRFSQRQLLAPIEHFRAIDNDLDSLEREDLADLKALVEKHHRELMGKLNKLVAAVTGTGLSILAGIIVAKVVG